MWVTGGSLNKTKTTEWIDFSKGNQSYGHYGYGPELPLPISSHCIIQKDSDTVLLIGGKIPGEKQNEEHQSSAVWSYNFVIGQWTISPYLWQSRYDHYCGKFKDSQSNRTFVVVAGGLSEPTQGTPRQIGLK